MDADLVVQLFHSMLKFIRMATIYKQIISLSLGQHDKLYIFDRNWHNKGCIYSWFYQAIDTDSKSTVLCSCSILHHSILTTIVKSNRRNWRYLVYSVWAMGIILSYTHMAWYKTNNSLERLVQWIYRSWYHSSVDIRKFLIWVREYIVDELRVVIPDIVYCFAQGFWCEFQSKHCTLFYGDCMHWVCIIWVK